MPDLGQRPGEIGTALAADGAARLILGLCSREHAAARVQVQARKAGLDSLGIGVVNLGTYAALTHRRPQATERAKILLAAAVARVRAFPGSGPENVKPCLPAKMSRRSLLTMPVPEYRPVPSIGEGCCADSGCRLCMRACPCEALLYGGDQIRVDKSHCESCGVCVAACPRDAIRFPGCAPSQLTAEITTLLEPVVGTLASRSILLICQRTALILDKLAKNGRSPPGSGSQHPNSDEESGSSRPGLLPVQVPCLGMLRATDVLSYLAQGAATVELAPCPGHCPLGQEGIIKGRVAYCRELLRRLGDAPDGVRLLSMADLSERVCGAADGQERTDVRSAAPAPARTGGTVASPSLGVPAAAEVLLPLAETRGASATLIFAHPNSPFGVIECTDGCTGCGVCAGACPTDALAVEREERGLSLTFDAALCTACGQCLPRCPEAENRVLRLHRVTDLRRLTQGKATLWRATYARCEACGGPIAPHAMLERLEATLGGEAAPALNRITRYCPDCRIWSGSLAPAAPPGRGAGARPGGGPVGPTKGADAASTLGGDLGSG